ncbi:pentapeptide repeat-containing protein [Litorimonas cladophorae]|uniref:pentapeptide repeat-containing protein n=1 Tax=Litorimonas cladophorae TaxID=1220491 RepID=UPI0016757E35|nr:pentapeptide repeat-containing protein [Litorimonas cladophorae]
MTQNINISPPKDFETFGPSELFRFFFQLGHWTEETFSSQLQTYARGKSVSTVTISKWKNRNVIPTHYTSAIFKLIESTFTTNAAHEWIAAFETVWAYHAAGKNNASALERARSFEETAANRVRDQHVSWVQSKYNAPFLGERFSIADLYVPMQMVEETPDTYVLYNPPDLARYMRHGWNGRPDADWLIVSGAPGSGKSLTALHLANSMSDSDVFPIYIRLSQRSSIQIGLSDISQQIGDNASLSSLLMHFRCSTYTTCCIVLDGLDEIGGTVSTSLDKLKEMISDIQAEKQHCRSQKKMLRVLAFGRSARAEWMFKLLPDQQSKLLKMVGLNGQITSLSQNGNETVGKDFRDMWWQKLLAAKGLSTQSPTPEFLSTDYNEFADFGTVPLLSYLLCRAAFSDADTQASAMPANELVDRITYVKNKNSVYDAIIDQVRQESIWRIETLKNPILEKDDFRAILQHIALANWKGGAGHQISVRQVERSIKDKRTRKIFRSLSFYSSPSRDDPTDNLSTVFYYGLNSPSEENVLTFTHKTFSDYLLSTLIFDAFIYLISCFSRGHDFDRALSNWLSICAAKSQDPSIADFCEHEAKLRYDDLDNLDWDTALQLLKAPIFSPTRNQEKSKTFADKIAQFNLASSLILLIWNCLNRERYRRQDTAFHLTNSDTDFSLSDLNFMQPDRTSDPTNWSALETKAIRPNFLGHSLSGLHLTDGQLFGLFLKTGHVQNTVFQAVHFSTSHWDRVRTDSCVFKACSFQQLSFVRSMFSDSAFRDCFFQMSGFNKVEFSGSRLRDTQFAQCHFADVDWSACELKDVIFDHCIFVNCLFEMKTRSAHATKFRQCTFVDMKGEYNTIPKTDLENCTYSKNSNAEFSFFSDSLEI